MECVFLRIPLLKKSTPRLARIHQILGTRPTARLCACRRAGDDEDEGFSPVCVAWEATKIPLPNDIMLTVELPHILLKKYLLQGGEKGADARKRHFG